MNTNKTIELEDAALDEIGKIIFTLLQELVDCAPLTTKDVEDYVSRYESATVCAVIITIPVTVPPNCGLDAEV